MSPKVRSQEIVTASGKMFNPLTPDPDTIDAYDIAHALGNLCRYTGHVRKFYSVGEHSVRCYQYLVDIGITDENTLRWVLLHDSPEAYINDIARPLKELEAYRAYRDAEDVLMLAIAERFGIEGEEPEEVKLADNVLLATEVRDLMPDSSLFSEWIQDHPTLEQKIHPWTPMEARIQFLYCLDAVGVGYVRPEVVL